MMKKYIIPALAAACCLCSCGKSPATGALDSTVRQFDAWVHVQKQKHPEYLWQQTELGSWILEDEEGSGEDVGVFQDSLYLRVNYTLRDLDGTISSTTSKIISQQLGNYNETYYYGPTVWYGKGIYAGLEDVMKDMKDGGRRKVLIPAWLQTFNRYTYSDGYLSQGSDEIGTSSVYELELVEHFPYIEEWAIDSLGRYLAANYSKQFGSDPAAAAADSSGARGFYYVRTKEPADTVSLRDTTIYINYIGRLLDGKVFDTNIRDTAIVYGLKRDSSYEPVSIYIGESWSETTMGSEGSSVIPGFARTLYRMKAFEKGTGIFWSSLGYGYSGSGSKIPGYAPLRFDVELVEQP